MSREGTTTVLRGLSTVSVQPSAFVSQIPSSITCLGRRVSRHGSSPSSATVALYLLQTWTCSLLVSFIPKAIWTSSSADHSFSIICQLNGWKWLSIAWGASKFLTASRSGILLKGGWIPWKGWKECPEHVWREYPCPGRRMEVTVQKLKEDNNSISAGSSNPLRVSM